MFYYNSVFFLRYFAENYSNTNITYVTLDPDVAPPPLIKVKWLKTITVTGLNFGLVDSLSAVLPISGLVFIV